MFRILGKSVAALAIAVPVIAQPYSESIVHAFIPAPYGQNPASALIQASDGNLYGTTYRGGASGYGTIFRIGDPGGAPSVTIIYAFTGGVDGGNPSASLIQASDGNLYGTTTGAFGLSGAGTVFRVSNLAGTPTLTVLYNFSGGVDGAIPNSALIEASDGNLYGTTNQGGTSGLGTVFRIGNFAGSPDFSVIHNFLGGADGEYPSAPLMQATDGNLYGTTYYGGTSGWGTVFAISDLAGSPTEAVIYSFAGWTWNDGSTPSAALIQAADGNLYGTTSSGGGANDAGTVFRISNLAGVPAESVIHSFAGVFDGTDPVAALIQASDGDLYGTTYSGGGSLMGTVFKIGNLAGVPSYSLVFPLTGGANGSNPSAPLIQGLDGNLYGTTFGGGVCGYGAVFEIGNLSGSPTYNVVYSLACGADGARPTASLIQAADGNLYGTAATWGLNLFGTVFKLGGIAQTPSFEVTYSFTGGVDGGGPSAALIQATDGNLYGTAAGGGTNGLGTVFKIGNLAGAPTESVLYSFAGGADGSYPNASLVEASDGSLYGTTTMGGPGSWGTVFRISNLSGTPTETVIYGFAGGPDGGEPYASLIQASDGNLYGTTIGNSTINSGTVFKISNLATIPTFSVIYTFTGGSDGGEPYAPLIQASDGNLYGTTSTGGAGGYGTVYSIGNLPSTPTFNLLHSFTGGVDGATPMASLIQASDGNLYGTTGNGGPSGMGTVYTISNLGGTPAENVLYSFSGVADGRIPMASLIEASDGNLYGTTSDGGVGGAGTVFALVKPCFDDVPVLNPFRSFICTIARNGITAGCGGGNFCPSSSVLRSQMAVFLLRGEHGSSYTPPASTGTFSDVPAADPFAPWIEELYNEQITGGCGTNPLIYCPADPVTRASMAVLLLRAQNGSGDSPPACTGIFADVACPGAFTDWIEALYAAGITGGCGTNPLIYCPAEPVTRAQMAVFLVATFNLQ